MLKGEGNMVAEYQEGREVCGLCEGAGELYFNDLNKLRFYFSTHDFNFRSMLQAYHEFKHTGYIKCPECDNGAVFYRR